jgi:uncharacterized protein YcfL
MRRLAIVLLSALALAACSSQMSAGLHATASGAQYAPPVAQIRGEPGYLALGDSIAVG